MDGVTDSKMTAGWLLLAAALSSVIALEVTGHMPLHARTSMAPPAQLPEEGPILRRVQPMVLDDIDDMLDRPLFHLSRRPPPPPDVDRTQRAGPAPASQLLKLVGTFHAGNGTVALFSHRERGMLRKRQGQEIEGWQVDRIERERVLLTRGGESEWLALIKPPSKPVATAQLLALKETSSAADTLSNPRSID